MRITLIILILVLIPLSHGLRISEVMYDPSGGDTGKEWIEIYNNDTVTYDLTGWNLNTNGSNHILRVPPAYGGRGSMIFSPGEYIIIAQNATFFISNHSFAGTVIDSSWTDLLNSANEMIWLANGAFIYANMTYYPNVMEGNTVCMINGGYFECVPTPGTANEIYVHDIAPPAVSSSHAPSNPVVNQTIVVNATATDDTGLEAIEIFVDSNHVKTCIASGLASACLYSTHALSLGSHAYYASANDSSGNRGISATNTITIVSNVTNSTQPDNTTNQTSGCDMHIEIRTDSIVYDVDNAISFDIFLNDTLCSSTLHNVSAEYLVEDVFGSIIKPIVNVTEELACFATISRQWTPHDISGSEAYYIRANIINTTCNDTNMANNNATRLVVVIGNLSSSQTEEIQINESAINITSVNIGSDNEVKYGETASVELKIYRGNTSKYAIDVWIDASGTKLSDISTIHMNSKFTEYKFQIPVQMKPNCDASFSDGVYTIIAEGLDTNATQSINVSGTSPSTCKTITVSSGSSGSSSSCGGGGGGGITTSSTSQTPAYDIINYSMMAEVGKEFTTTVKITNNFTKPKNFTVYSYVFKGNEPVSMGYDDSQGRWMSTYTANNKSVSLGPLSSETVKLKNKIENGTEPGVYSLRVRIKVDGKDNDITKDMVVVEGKNSVQCSVIPTKTNATESKNSLATNVIQTNDSTAKKSDGKNTMTGFAVQEISGLFSSPILVFIQMLLRF